MQRLPAPRGGMLTAADTDAVVPVGALALDDLADELAGVGNAGAVI